jgi:hypothetical protein
MQTVLFYLVQINVSIKNLKEKYLLIYNLMCSEMKNDVNIIICVQNALEP